MGTGVVPGPRAGLTGPWPLAAAYLAAATAACVKLTPAIFAVYKLVTRRYRAAGLAAPTFAATVAIGFVVLPGPSAHYWNLTTTRPQRISPAQNDTNQSLLGAIARDTGQVPGSAWLLAVVAIAVVGLWLAARAFRHGNEAGAFGLCAVTGLLVSPISWTHHWVIEVPALLAATVTAWRAQRTSAAAGTDPRSPAARPVAATAALAGVAVAAVIGWSGLARRVPGFGDVMEGNEVLPAGLRTRG
jgi:Glycosyltransferase family 87